MARISQDRMRGVLGPVPKPAVVWQRQFDYNDEALAEIARMDWDKIPDDYLWYCFHDMAYQELQPDFFRHFFPACLRYWYETLMRDACAEYGDSEFHYGLLQGDVLAKMMHEEERGRLCEFFRDGFLDRLEAQDSFQQPAMHWIFRFNTLGMAAPVIPDIWKQWWKCDHPGKAIAAIAYASGLIYLAGENPLFERWTLPLTEIDAPLFRWGWRDDNLEYLKNVLSSDYVLDRMDLATAALKGHPDEEMSKRVANDAKERREVIQLRIEDLIEDLPKINRPLWDER